MLGYGGKETVYDAGGNVNECSHYRNQYGISKQSQPQIDQLHYSAILLWSIGLHTSKLAYSYILTKDNNP